MDTKPFTNEVELIQKVANGDRRAFTVLFNSHYKSLSGYVYKLTESLEVAEEIVQDVFVKIWLKRETLESINNFSNYIFILSKNQTLNYLRQKANDQIRLKEWENEYEQAVKDDLDQTEAFCLLIDEAINELPMQQKKIYQFSRGEKLKYEEIATELNISSETVKKHMYLASKAIKEYVKNHIDNVVLIFLLTQTIIF
jgi:RNA polymerase sigma-70 factor (family 1)